MTADHFRLCLHLDARGYPCNRRTMKPLSLCSLHRPKVVTSGTRMGAEYQRQRRAKLSQAGTSPAMEGANG